MKTYGKELIIDLYDCEIRYFNQRKKIVHNV